METQPEPVSEWASAGVQVSAPALEKEQVPVQESV